MMMTRQFRDGGIVIELLLPMLLEAAHCSNISGGFHDLGEHGRFAFHILYQ